MLQIDFYCSVFQIFGIMTGRCVNIDLKSIHEIVSEVMSKKLCEAEIAEVRETSSSSHSINILSNIEEIPNS